MRSPHTCKPGIISASIVFLLLLLSSFGGAARPFSVPESEDRRDPIKLFDELLIGDVKQSGPSPGVGHKVPTSAATLGGIKVASTPSLGVGSDRRILGGTSSRPLSATLNDSGPSPGVGH